MNSRVLNIDGMDGKVDNFMGFINLITIDDYVKEGEKYIYEKYGIKKEELQNMQEDDFLQLREKVIKKYIDIDNCVIGNYGWRLVKTCEGEELEFVDGIDKYISYISEKYKKTNGCDKEAFLEEMEMNLKKIVSCAFSFFQYDIWCDFYLLLKYTDVKDIKYDPYENGAYFTDVNNSDLPFSADDKDFSFPIFAREIQRNLYKDTIRIFSDLYDNSLDISRYGIRKTESIISSIEQSIENNIEELLIIDKVMGISLTNIIFWNTKDVDKEKWDDIIEISKQLACMKSNVVGKLVGEMACVYMRGTNYDDMIMNKLKSFIDNNMTIINSCFDDLKRIFLISIYDKKEKDNLLSLLEELSQRTGYLTCDAETKKYRFFKMNMISDILDGGERIRINKKKVNTHELYALIHRAVIQGIVETNRGSAKR